MIIDHIDNAGNYDGFGRRITAALSFLQTANLRHLETGRHEIEGADIYAIVNHYTTMPIDSGRLETHRRCIDVHYMVDGMELIGYACTKHLRPEPYDAQRDMQLHAGRADYLLLREGMFAVMLPDDAHMPGIAVDTPKQVKKVVVKVGVE